MNNAYDMHRCMKICRLYDVCNKSVHARSSAMLLDNVDSNQFYLKARVVEEQLTDDFQVSTCKYTNQNHRKHTEDLK